jgi:hypothetical protein
VLAGAFPALAFDQQPLLVFLRHRATKCTGTGGACLAWGAAHFCVWCRFGQEFDLEAVWGEPVQVGGEHAVVSTDLSAEARVVS